MDNDELRGLLAKLDEHSDGDYLSRLANGACIASDCAVYLREHGARLLADSEAYAKLRARIAGAAVGMLAEYEHANDRATFLYFNGSGAVETGVEYALLRLPAGEGE